VREVDVQYIDYFNNPLGNSSPEILLQRGTDGIPWTIAVTDLNADTSTAQVYLRDSSSTLVPEYTIEVSTRPMIGFVWIGTILVTLGGLISMRRRALEGRVEIAKPDPAPIPDRARAPEQRKRRAQQRPATAFTAEVKGTGR
jgi:hypothetical protein